VEEDKMPYSERLNKAAEYCENNEGYCVVADGPSELVILVRNATGYVRTAQVA
jgi:hypothetical protein